MKYKVLCFGHETTIEAQDISEAYNLANKWSNTLPEMQHDENLYFQNYHGTWFVDGNKMKWQGNMLWD